MLQVTPTVIITKRNTVNKENLTNQNVLLTTKKGMLPYKQDLLHIQERIRLNIQKTHGKQPRQILAANSHSKFSNTLYRR